MHKPTFTLIAGVVLLFVPAAWGRTDGLQTSCHTSGRTLAAWTSYDDPIEDSGNAPDFCGGEAVTNDNQTIMIGIHAHNRSGLVPGDSYGIYLDTDMNAATGGGEIGAEYEITLDGTGARLAQWNGTTFQPSTATVEMQWADGYGPVIALDRKAVGNPSGFRLVMTSANGTDSDRAPDEGTWSYTVTPLRLQVKPLSHGPAVAGKSFVARMIVMRNDFDVPLDEGTILCAGRIGTRSIAGTGRFAHDRIVCTWRLPSTARGKRLAGSVAVTFQGVHASRAFSVTVQ
jgi:hypothetical protein